MSLLDGVFLTLTVIMGVYTVVRMWNNEMKIASLWVGTIVVNYIALRYFS